MNPIKLIALIALCIDLVWATLIATFGASLLSIAGSETGASEVVAATTSVTGWIIAFVIAFFQGGVFIVVCSAFTVLGAVVYSKLPAGGRTLVKIGIVLDLIWATCVATFMPMLLTQVFAAAGIASSGSGLAAVLLWFIAFIIAFIQGAVFLAVGSVFAVVIIVLIASLAGFSSSRSSGGPPMKNDRFPGEPPHR